MLDLITKRRITNNVAAVMAVREQGKYVLPPSASGMATLF